MTNTSWAICDTHSHFLTCSHMHILLRVTHKLRWNPVFSYAVRLQCLSQRAGSIVTTATLNGSNSSHTPQCTQTHTFMHTQTYTGTHSHKSSVLQCYGQIPQTLFWCLWPKKNRMGPDCRKQPQWIDARRRAASREVIKSEIWTRALLIEEMQRKLKLPQTWGWQKPLQAHLKWRAIL